MVEVQGSSLWQEHLPPGGQRKTILHWRTGAGAVSRYPSSATNNKTCNNRTSSTHVGFIWLQVRSLLQPTGWRLGRLVLRESDETIAAEAAVVGCGRGTN